MNMYSKFPKGKPFGDEPLHHFFPNIDCKDALYHKSSNNDFFDCFYHAWLTHGEIVISPDDIWL